MTDNLATASRLRLPYPRLLLAGLTVSLLWANWPTLTEMASRWESSPQYSHGYLVAPFALFLLWRRRAEWAPQTCQPNSWGLAMILGGAALHFLGVALFIGWLEGAALLPMLAGLAVLLGGWQALRWSAPAIGFLFFMLPLPYSVESLLAYPLRLFATRATAYGLQTLGLPALAEGTDILLNEHKLQVAAACSGLSMLLTFFALSTALILVVRRPWSEQAVIIASAIPIALLVNVARLMLTALLFELGGSEAAHKVFHDWSGFLMMPMALALLGLELKFLKRLFVPVAPPQPVAFDFFRVQSI